MEEDAIVKISHSRFERSQFSRGDFLHLHHNQPTQFKSNSFLDKENNLTC
ncbi:hypothetical protein H6G93_18785 [Nostoc sp. FACHB-973]|uniref:Uncharacterized protein n=1 Tax=Desmonostoc muscorum LEGE 12446 TaxID=1828758 RepID=A0A8J6ZW03_DESMC|nr:hypothetical protein [Desmonostoc muscorum]MBD2517026.1 hypothetical protein [Nostoc sp. FACHB-973]MCF2152206.1 hypothetical protein [Desmonostoc muscorum LEGE 12446]